MSTNRYSHVNIGKNLAAWRRRHYFTQRKLADALHLFREAVAEIEAGRRKLTFIEALVLHTRFHLEFEDLIRRS